MYLFIYLEWRQMYSWWIQPIDDLVSYAQASPQQLSSFLPVKVYVLIFQQKCCCVQSSRTVKADKFAL